MRKLSIFVLFAALMAPAAAAPFTGLSEDQIVAAIDAAVAKKKATGSFSAALIKALNDDEAGIRVRERAAWALGELGVKSAAPALLKAAGHKGLLIRSAAAGALARLRPASAIPVFIKIAKTDPIRPLRQRAVIALGLFRSEKTIEPLVELSSDPSPEIRGASALAMAATHSKKNDFSEILKEMTADESDYVRERAETGLTIAKGKPGDVLELLKSADQDVRLVASLYFEGKGGSKELPTLRDAWNTEPEEDVRAQLQRSIVATKRRIQAEKERRARLAREKAAKEKAAREKAAREKAAGQASEKGTTSGNSR